MSQSNQNTPDSKPSNGDDFLLKEDHLGVNTTSPNTNDSSPSQHGIRGSEGHISGNLNKAIDGRQRAIAAGNQLKQDWLDAEHWRALAKARNYRLPHWYLPLTATGMEEVLHDLNLDRDFFREGVDVQDEYTEKAGGKKVRYLGAGAWVWERHV